jgi:hypothetical protein
LKACIPPSVLKIISASSLVAAVFFFVFPQQAICLHGSEVLYYEVMWKGAKAGHGDISMKRNAKKAEVILQAVSDGYLKALIEIWTRITATFSVKTFSPRSYKYRLRSNILPNELVQLAFDHKKSLVKVNKNKGGNVESHSEKFSRVYDPVSAVYLLRYQRSFDKPMFVDIYDGKDKVRLFVKPAGQARIRIRAGVYPAIGLSLSLVKLTGDRKQIGTGQLWISNDDLRIPLLLTSRPIVGTVRFELVKASLPDLLHKKANKR